jgi:serine/threonine protein kinase/tetratricopeptide (TPR) repeat protein
MQVFEDMRDVPEEARPLWLQRICDGDERLLAAVEQMVAADEDDAFLTHRPAAQDAEHMLGAYQVLRTIGTGGMGTVHLAEVRRPVLGLEVGAHVALKLIHPHLLEAEGFFKRFLREAQVGMRVEHQNVVRTFDCDAVMQDGQHHHFLVMEYVEGQTLLGLLTELEQVPEELCLHVAREIVRALCVIHEGGIVHRDLKLENVLITEEHVVKVMDLGIAHLMGEAVRLSRTGQFVGTLAYAAPEQIRGGDQDLDGRADLYALGVMLYQLATGHLPLRHGDPAQMIRLVLEEQPRRISRHQPQLSPYFEELVHTLLAKDPVARFPNARALLEAVEHGEDSAWWQARARALRAETRRPLRRIRVPRDSALHGRDAELATLRALYEDAQSGKGRVLLVEGEAGIGKTRLVDEFVAGLRDEDASCAFLFGAYPPGGGVSAWSGFATAFREQLGTLGLADTVAGLLPTSRGLADAFASILREEGVAVGADREVTEEVLQSLFVQVSRGIAAAQPTIILIDDLHCAPDAGRALFAALARAVIDHRVLLIGNLRPGHCEDWQADVGQADHVTRLSLRRLGAKDLFKLLQDSFQSDALAADLGMQIAMKSDGNPFFAFEIIRSLKESGHVAQRADGSWQTLRTIERIEIPSSILSLIQARLRGLSEAERDLLEVAACLGSPFDPGLVGSVLGEARLPLLKRCARIERGHQLIRSAGRLYVFDHQQVSEAIYDALHEQMRETYHASIAEALLTRAAGGAIGGAAAAELCDHAARGAQPALARDQLAAALEHLAAGYEHARLAMLAESYLAVPDLLSDVQRVDVLLRRAGALDASGQSEAQEAALREAIELAESIGDTGSLGRSRILLGGLLTRLARYEKAQRELEAARALADAAGAIEDHIDAALKLGQLHQARGRYEKAEELYQACLTFAASRGDRHRELQARLQLGSVVRLRGDYDAAMRHSHRGLELARALEEPVRESSAHTTLGIVLMAQGRYDEAAAHFEENLRLARETGSRLREMQGRTNMSNLRGARGQLKACLDLHGPALQLAREIGARRSEAICLVNLAGKLVRLGALERGVEAGEESLAISRQIGAKRVEGYALQTLGVLADVMGNAEEAERLFHQAIELRREIGYRRGVGSALGSLGALHADLGRLDEAREELTQAETIAREMDSPTNALIGACLLASIGAGDPVAAGAELEASGARMRLEDRLEAHRLLWKATGAREHLEAAHTLLMYEVEHAPQEHHESMLTSVPANAEIVAGHAALADESHAD